MATLACPMAGSDRPCRWSMDTAQAFCSARGPDKKTASRHISHKSNADHRQLILKMRHFVRNWPEYEAGLRNRGTLMFWVIPQAMQLWLAQARSTVHRV